MINRPHALYYNGELIGIILNPDPHGDISTICDALSPDEGLADAVTIPNNMGNMEEWGQLANALVALEIKETIDRPSDPSDPHGDGHGVY